VFTDRWGIGLLLFEIVVLGLIAFIARQRSWSLFDLGIRPTWGLTAAGVGLYLVGILATLVVYWIVAASIGSVARASMTARGLSMGTVVLVSIINPIFEETLVVGYVVRATSSHGSIFAVTISALLRLLYHTYQGPIAAVSILPIGLIFAAVYIRFRELWPLIVAHALMDLIALSHLSSVVA
jgi:CAAX protease family protein